MSLLNDGEPVPLHEIPRGAYVQVEPTRWRKLEGWYVLDKSTRPDAPRYSVRWVGTEDYPSTFVKEPAWPVWVGDEPPSTTGVAS